MLNISYSANASNPRSTPGACEKRFTSPLSNNQEISPSSNTSTLNSGSLHPTMMVLENVIRQHRFCMGCEEVVFLGRWVVVAVVVVMVSVWCFSKEQRVDGVLMEGGVKDVTRIPMAMTEAMGMKVKGDDGKSRVGDVLGQVKKQRKKRKSFRVVEMVEDGVESAKNDRRLRFKEEINPAPATSPAEQKHHELPLVQQDSNPPLNSTLTTIPKLIWTYWDTHDPEPLPWMITAMTRGWSHYNPTHILTILRPTTLRIHLRMPLPANFHSPTTTPQQRANWIRLAILTDTVEYGSTPSTVLTGPIEHLWNPQTQSFAFRLDAFGRNVLRLILSPRYLMDVGRWITAWFNEYNTDGYARIIQTINDPAYLKLTVASQRVLMDMDEKEFPESIEAEDSGRGAYAMLKEAGYEDWEYARRLLGQRVKAVRGVYKLRGPTRQAVEEMVGGVESLGDVALGDSVFGQYVVRFFHH
ncbi:hypothetical protein BC829DRAFT_404556 [Chytridium lagenaria]|nr:hypothetical protein BC829DRAFT_404556 [Chytridium lagenaria]